MSKTEPNFSVSTIKSRPIQSKVDLSRIGQTADWSSLGKTIDLGLSNHTKIMNQIEVEEGQDDTNLQRRINKAKAQGNEAKQARLEGKQKRIDIRQKERAKRIKQRNIEQKKQTQARQDKKNERFKERREDGNVPVSSAGQIIQKVVGLVNSPIPMNMSAAQYKDMQKFSKIAKDI